MTSRRLMFSLFVGDDHGIESNRLIEWGLAPEVSQWQLWSNRVVLTVLSSLPVCPGKRTSPEPVGTSHLCHFRK